MLLNIKWDICNTEEADYFENANYSIWWEGLIFIPGILSGRDSIKHFFDLVNNSGLSSATEALSGFFHVFYSIKRKKNIMLSQIIVGLLIYFIITNVFLHHLLI